MFANLPLLCLSIIGLLTGAGLLHLLPRLGQAGERLSKACCRAPFLDAVIFYFTVLPLILGPIVAGWPGLLSAVLAQLATLLIWQSIHEALHRDALKGPRIIRVLTGKFGAFRVLAAAYITGLATPIFWFARLGELTIYPALVLLVKLPSYNSAEWVNVSRHKFHGLVGHDLLWCLYCDWMTGVWSLGSEMLRNVESLACPIRFSCEKKCENCAIDFPDVDNGWVKASGNMKDVAETLECMYPSSNEPQAWFGHRLRTTHPDRRPRHDCQNASKHEPPASARSDFE
jgi:hypothetical protein